MARPTRAQIAGWLVLLLGIVVLTARAYDSIQVGVERDDAIYLILARSLFHAPGYGMANAPGQPGPSPFPFGYPLLISPFEQGPGLSVDGPRLLSLGATMLNASLVFWGWPLLTSVGTRNWGLAVAALYGLSPQVITEAHEVMSEPLFMTFVLLSLLVTQRLVIAPKHSLRLFLMLGILLTLTASLRTIGLVAPAVIGWYLISRSGWRAFPYLAATGLTMCMVVVLVLGATSVQIVDLLPLQYRATVPAVAPPVSTADVMDNPTPQSESSGLSLVAHAWHDYAFVHLRSVVLPLGGSTQERGVLEAATGMDWTPDLIGALVLATCAIGLATWIARDGPSLWLMFLGAYGVAVLVWPWGDRRYLYAIEPHIYLMFLLGSSAVLARLSRVAIQDRLPLRYGAIAIAGVLLSAAVLSSLRADDSRLHVADLALRTEWIASASVPDDVLMSEEPQIDAIYTGLHTVGFGPLENADDVLRYADASHVSFVLVAPSVWWQPAYRPEYSWRSLTLLAAVNTLVERGQAASVFVSSDGWIRVFRLHPSAA